MRVLLPAVTLALVMTPGLRAHAASDGVYGRLDGDLDLSLSAAAAVPRDGSTGFETLARALYLSTAGLYAGLTDTRTADERSRRDLSLGVALRPLFLPRWSYDLEQGPPWLDLSIDSLTLELGALVPLTHYGSNQTVGLELALGLEFPFFARAAGPWLFCRGSLDWAGSDLASVPSPSPAPRGVLALGLSWHELLPVHLVDAGDRLHR